MKRLKIRNLGPILEADITLEQTNVIIGLQSSGKSCVLKTVCYCSWVEKRIQLVQSADEFSKDGQFLALLIQYHKMLGYVRQNTFIEYDSLFMHFSYDHSKKTFDFQWKEQRWDFCRPKISYVPSERNLVAIIPQWSKLPLENDNLLDFMNDWDAARHREGKVDGILNLGVGYHYDQQSNTDSIILPDNSPIRLYEGSSGIQSLIPLYVHLQHMFGQQFDGQMRNNMSFEQKQEIRNLVSSLYSKSHEGISVAEHVRGKTLKVNSENRMMVVGSTMYLFENEDAYLKFNSYIKHFLENNHNEIFLEEPENNLFPSTQCQLVDWIVDNMQENDRDDVLFVATHSPYVLNQFIKDKPKGFRVFITHKVRDDGKYSVHQLSDDEIQDAYFNGVDLFFNYESYL